MGQVAAVAISMTKMTARDMPTAEFSFLDTPEGADAEELGQHEVVDQPGPR